MLRKQESMLIFRIEFLVSHWNLKAVAPVLSIAMDS